MTGDYNSGGSCVGRVWCWIGWHHWVSWVILWHDPLGRLDSEPKYVAWCCTRRGCKAEGRESRYGH